MGSLVIPFPPSGGYSVDLFRKVFGRPGALRSFRVSPDVLTTTTPSATLVPSSSCCHEVYRSDRSGLTPLMSHHRGILHPCRSEDRGLPEVAMRAQYRHARITHATAVNRTRLPLLLRGSPLRWRWLSVRFPRACRLALGPFGFGVSPDTLPCATGFVRLHPLLGSHSCSAR